MMNRSGQLPNLEKIFKDDDEQDFTPLGGSNLAAIFDNSLKSNDLNSSLRIQQQKKTFGDKNLNHPSSTGNKTKIIVAKVVHAYKLQNGQYNLMGKLNIALTGNNATNTYILILYRDKTEHISVTKLTYNFSYSVCENNYATYYDSNNDNWSILFENIDSCIELAREIGISKYFLTQNKTDDNVIYQDLTASTDGEEAKQDDKVSVKYFIITSITQPLKINTGSIQNSIVEITTDNNWEKSLVGTKKNLKRLLFLSPSKQISLGPGFPRDKDIALEIEITDIIRPEPLQIPSPNSITSSGKASLISRMAKMGRSMLPKLPSSTTTDSDDTEEEVHVKSPRRLRNAELTDGQKKSPQSDKPSPSIEQSTDMPIASGHLRSGQKNIIANPHGTIVSTMPYPNLWGATPIQQQYLTTADGQLYPIQPTLPQPMATVTDPNINVFLSESRTHNAEIRMGMSKIADNVQKLIDKFHVLEVQNATSPNNEKSFESSLKMLLALKNDKADNRTMEVDYNSKMNGSLGVTISQEELKKLEDDLKTTKNSLAESLSRLETVETKRRNVDAEKLQVETENLRLKSSLADSQCKCDATLSDLKKSDATAIQYQKDNAKLEGKISLLNEKIKVLENAMASNKNISVTQNDKAAEIKEIMNKTYQTLITKFTEDSYTTDYIRTTVAKTIKAITLQVLKEDKNGAETHAFNDSIIKESTRNSSRIESTEDESINPPGIDNNSTLGMNVLSVAQDEPPPIPPMDPDVESDWTL